MLKKQEVETARLLDFEFRERVRTMRLLAPRIDAGLSAEVLVAEVAQGPDEAVLAKLRRDYPARADEIDALFAAARTEARLQLIAERGDPSPYRFL